MRKGIEDYDKRHGWRGPITNKLKNVNWKKRLSQYKLDPTLNWNFAEIVDLNNTEIKIKILSDEKSLNIGYLKLSKIKWTIPKNKTISDRFNLGDIIFVKKEKILGSKTIPKGKWRYSCFRPF